MQIAPVSTTTFVFSPKTHFTFYLLSSWMRRWAISAAIYLSREEEASINTIINIKLRVVRGRFSIIFLKSYINFFFWILYIGSNHWCCLFQMNNRKFHGFGVISQFGIWRCHEVCVCQVQNVKYMLLKIYYYLYIEFKFLMLWLMHMFRKKNSQIGFWKLFSLLKVKEVNFWHEKEVENF